MGRLSTTECTYLPTSPPMRQPRGLRAFWCHMIFFLKTYCLILNIPHGEGTDIAAGRLWKIGNIVHFHEECHKIH